MSKIIIIISVILFLIGLVLHFFPHIFSWIGKLPGDISYKRKNIKFFFPLVSGIIISIVLSLIINYFKK